MPDDPQSPDPAEPSRPSLAACGRLERRGDRRGAMRALLLCLESSPLDPEALAKAASLARDLGHTGEERRFTALAREPGDPQARYELGYLLVDAGIPALGSRYLELCLDLVPDHPLVGYELGYARMRAGDHAGAEPLLERALVNEGLTDEEVFSAGSLLVECLLRRGDPVGARAILERVERFPGGRDEGQLDALSRLVVRAERLLPGTPTRDRDWHFIQNGGVLLHSPRDTAGALPAGLVGLDFLAALVRRLERLLTVVEARPQRVVAVVPALRPVAFAIARRLGVEATDALGAEAPGLFLLRGPSDADPHLASLRRADDGSVVAALYLDPRIGYNLLPDVVGQFAERLVLPWDDRIELFGDGEGLPRVVRSTEAEDMDRLGLELAEAVERMEGDADDLDALDRYYRPLRDLLVVNRPDDEPLRRVAVALRSN